MRVFTAVYTVKNIRKVADQSHYFSHIFNGKLPESATKLFRYATLFRPVL